MISVIVGNYSYSYLLPAIMQSYNWMDRPPCELEMIIVDDSSDPDDHFEEFVRLGVDRIKPWYEIRAFMMPLSCSKMNWGRTQNVGVKQSKGDILILHHAQFMQIGKKTLTVMYEKHQEEPMMLLRPTHLKDKPPQEAGRILTLDLPECASISRAMYYDMGGFDETFDGYGHNDTDFIWRIKRGIDMGLKPQWKLFKDERLLILRPTANAIGLKRSVYPNRHNEERVNYNTNRRICSVNPDGWGECEGLIELKL